MSYDNLKGLVRNHILTTNQFTVDQIDGLFELVDKRIRPFFEGERGKTLCPRIAIWKEDWAEFYKYDFDFTLATVFGQPSTRTRMSFEAAVKKLGGNTIDFGNEAMSSMAKGESWMDTIEVISQYSDAIAVRTKLDELPKMMATYSDVPIINCGSGTDEHPTQALLDLYTIKRCKGEIDGLNVVIFGDINNARTISSFKTILSNYRVSIAEIDILNRHIDPFEEYMELFKKADVIYVTRMQREYHGEEVAEFPGITTHRLVKKTLSLLKDDAVILHPGPVLDEVDHEVRKDPRWVYKDQVKNGLYIRMALLKAVFGHI